LALYTFYCWRADGSGGSFETRELVTDDQALALAPKVLSDHASCERVEIFEGERPVGVIGPTGA
jgi:hypothetical protein